MIPAGFLAARGELTLHSPAADLSLAFAAGLAGSIAGAYFNYYLSARLGEPFLRRHSRWFFIKPAALDRAFEVFNRYGAATTFVCRLVPVIRQLISIPAGLAKMPLGRFTLFTALGAGVWTAILAAVGYTLGRTAGDISYTELVHRGKDLAGQNLPWVILGALVLAGSYPWLFDLEVMGEVNGAPVGIVKGQAGTVSNIAGMEAPTEIPKDGGARMGSRGRCRWHSGGGGGESLLQRRKQRPGMPRARGLTAGNGGK
jgi:membrane protein DedA with SNARE-associated domain